MNFFFQSIFFFFLISVDAQVNVDLNLDELHQEWHFSNSESGNDQITLYSNFRRPEELGDGVYSYSFSRRDSVFYIQHAKNRNFARCGNGSISTINSNVPFWSKGIWKLI